MMQLDLFNNTTSTPSVVAEKSPDVQYHTKKIKESTHKLLDEQKYNFEQEDYSSYKISIENGNISKVYFSTGKYKFLVHLDTYSFQSKDMPVNHYYEPDASERDTTVSTKVLRDFKIKGIQKKEKAGYGAFKEYVEYFRFAGIKYSTLKRFLESLIKQYHGN